MEFRSGPWLLQTLDRHQSQASGRRAEKMWRLCAGSTGVVARVSTSQNRRSVRGMMSVSEIQGHVTI